MRPTWRSPIPAASVLLLVAGLSLLATVGVAGRADAVSGRYSVESDAGGAVWSFRDDGRLVVIGPGDLQADGHWSAVAGDGAFDATLSVTVTDQALRILGTASPDGRGLALYVEATEPGSPADGTPWPPVSRLIGARVGLTDEASPRPSLPAQECLRPRWLADGQVDWYPCGWVPDPSADPASPPDPSRLPRPVPDPSAVPDPSPLPPPSASS
jgi:hypothetical protein